MDIIKAIIITIFIIIILFVIKFVYMSHGLTSGLFAIYILSAIILKLLREHDI